MTAPLQKMTDRERRLLLDVGLRHNYAAVGDRWVDAECEWKSRKLLFKCSCLWSLGAEWPGRISQEDKDCPVHGDGT